MFAWCRRAGLAEAPIWSLSNINCEEITSWAPPGPWETLEGPQHYQHLWLSLASVRSFPFVWIQCCPYKISYIPYYHPNFRKICSAGKTACSLFLLSSDSKSSNESDLINILGATQWRARPSDQRTENKIPGWKALWCRNRVFTTIYTRRGIWRGRRCWPLVSPDLFHKPLRSSSK